MTPMRCPRRASILLAAALSAGCGGPEFTTAPDLTAPLAAELEAGAPADPPADPHPDADVPRLEVAMHDAAPDAGPPIPEAAPPVLSPVEKCLDACPTGCCDVNGLCHNDGTTNDVCGTRASRLDGMCVNCTIVGAYCNANQECSVEPPDGGRGSYEPPQQCKTSADCGSCPESYEVPTCTPVGSCSCVTIKTP
jgi:hypothetical protein